MQNDYPNTIKEPGKLVPEKELIKWTAPSRPFKRRGREFYSTVGVIVLLVSIILFFAKEFLLIGVVLSLVFTGYALGSVPPATIEYIISNKGYYVGGVLYPFGELGRYWIENKWKQEVLMIEHMNKFPRIVMGVLSNNRQELEKQLNQYLVNEKPELTGMDRAAKWLTEKVPLETE